MKNRNSPIHQSQPYGDTITAIRDWLTSTLTYIRRRNHLPADEKSWLLERFHQCASYYSSIVTDYHEGGHFKASSVQDHLLGVAKLNWVARFYEFPAYPIPEPYPMVIECDYISSEVRDNSMEGVAFKGDELISKQVYTIADLMVDDLIVVTFRHNYRSPRRAQVGYFKGLKGNTLYLRYDHPKLVRPRKPMHFSMFDVVNISRVKTVSADWE